MRNCTPDRWSNLSKVTQAICVRARIQTCLWAPAFWNILFPTGSTSYGWNATIYTGEMPLVLSICLWGGAITYCFVYLMEFQQSWKTSLSAFGFHFVTVLCFLSSRYRQSGVLIMQGQPHIYLCANTQNQALSSVPLPESYPGDHRTFQYPCTNRSQSCRSSLGTGGVAVTIHPSHGSQGKTSSQCGCLFYGCCGPTLSKAFPRPRLSVFCLFCTGF